MHIHKIEIARRQIEVAADLFFAGGDFLAVITLAGAADEILGNFIRRKGKPAMIDHLKKLDERMHGERPYSEFNKDVNGLRNALKHANDKKEDEIEANSDGAIAMLSSAVANYVSLNEGQITPNMIRVYEHLKVLYPDFER